MSIAQSLSNQNVYGVTYATVDSSGIHFESELAIQLSDGTLTTLHMPTHLSERQAIQQLLCGRPAC
ncbi:type III secretion system co-regulatory protein PtrC [Pseudomonas sp. SG20056]|uniref:type III secretion system co-regulatory protein PtrC n=1 Tax=Pseudomonas sp. SG20056 TaxID=3074146 RepID=UPI00287FD99A|nr:type III secretion system co-regulatory protein PtrC [Pseudomonas sp. SG20056]WNF45186.1 type III secretion system co-regulatory protein PtrC [Pseudomonas sp. SG20056]